MPGAPRAARFPRFHTICLLLASACAAAFPALPARAATNHFPALADLPARESMPDPLVMLDGAKVTSTNQWAEKRRPELRALFQHYMYGRMPQKPPAQTATVVGEYHDFLDGKATLRLVTLGGSSNAPRIDLMLVLPNRGSNRAPVPVFLAVNFCGNDALTAEPRVPLPQTWMPGNCPGCVSNRPANAARGTQATNWPLAEIVRRGYGLASFYHGDVDSDRPDASTGVYQWQAQTFGGGNEATNRGTIMAWAWGFARCLDYLETVPDVDGKKIAVVGHSRNGKAALVAAAFDDRIAIAFAHQAGCGGSSPSRGKVGESLKVINARFPHWFNAEFKQFVDAPDRLPFDQNCLVALCAPRPVLFTAAEDDQWSNPAGQFQVLLAAAPVYRLLGAEGIAATEMPPRRKLVDSRLGYYIREGKHSMLADDWRVFMDYADKQWNRTTPPP
jgi:dienelactone hydrolase